MPLQPFPDQTRPLIFAHRGASAIAPENSLAAFKAARAMGSPGIELDIHRCASGELVVFHDDTSKRISPGSTLHISDSTWQDIRQLDIGSWKGPQWSSERPILLSELFEEFGSNFYYDIEIKAPTAKDRGCETALAALLDDFGMTAANVAVSSFNPISIKRFKTAAPKIPTAIIYCHSDELPWYLRDGLGSLIGGADFLKPEHVLVGTPLVTLLSRLGKKALLPWTIDDASIASRMLAAGCDGVISNAPDQLGLPKVLEHGGNHE
jgi:glycerophosphoryl diester phosphodiesterase